MSEPTREQVEALGTILAGEVDGAVDELARHILVSGVVIPAERLREVEAERDRYRVAWENARGRAYWRNREALSARRTSRAMQERWLVEMGALRLELRSVLNRRMG